MYANFKSLMNSLFSNIIILEEVALVKVFVKDRHKDGQTNKFSLSPTMQKGMRQKEVLLIEMLLLSHPLESKADSKCM